jgi:hypothetical protein
MLPFRLRCRLYPARQVFLQCIPPAQDSRLYRPQGDFKNLADLFVTQASVNSKGERPGSGSQF